MTRGFSDQFNAWVKATNKTMHQGIANTTIRLGTMIIEKTPVDTGRAKGNWMSAFDAPDTATSETRQAAQSIGGLHLKFTPSSVARNNSIFITNSLPYIKRLENGYSKQAPAGMVRLSIAEFTAILQREIASAKRI
jgi:hypothetical protein